MATNITSSVRVRFAPSPTGHLHIGGLRTALFNWLFAKHHNGAFLLRIEDTDRERSKDEFTRSISDSLTWAGIIPDEKPITQSERVDEHKKVAYALLKEGKAYRCYCSAEQVAERSEQRTGDITHVQYDGLCRTVQGDESQSHVIRFKIPDTIGDITFSDRIRGDVTIPRDQLDDFIIVRSDGSPMYNFVVVVDDAYMNISHVIRGEDHIANTPKQILLYQALGYRVPQFVHIPLVLGPSGQRLSKREAATAVTEYKENGYLSKALVNYLARLGWAHGDQELFTQQELIDLFTLDAVSKSGAIFDTEKLNWINSVYIREKSNEALYMLISAYGDTLQESVALELIALYKDRIKTLKELYELVLCAHNGPATYNDVDLQKWITLEAKGRLKSVIDILQNVSEWDSKNISNALKSYAKNAGIKIVTIAQPIRIALLGVASGPGVFALCVVLGKDEVVRRIALLQKVVAHIDI